MIDRNDYLYNRKQNRYHLGLLSSWGMQGRETYPMISKLLEKVQIKKLKDFSESLHMISRFTILNKV